MLERSEIGQLKKKAKNTLDKNGLPTFSPITHQELREGRNIHYTRNSHKFSTPIQSLYYYRSFDYAHISRNRVIQKLTRGNYLHVVISITTVIPKALKKFNFFSSFLVVGPILNPTIQTIKILSLSLKLRKNQSFSHSYSISNSQNSSYSLKKSYSKNSIIQTPTSETSHTFFFPKTPKS